MLQRARLNRILVAVFFVGAGMLLGCLLKRPPVSADKVAYQELEKFSKVLQLIESDFVEEKSTKVLVEGAIRGMLASLDPHSAYLSPEIYKEMKVETSGKFGGLGIEVTMSGGVITVVSPIEDTPAYRAGIKTGDRIVRIDDKSTKNMTLPEAVTMMRGKTGSKIRILVLRGNESPREYVLKRESIKIQSVRYARLPNNVGYTRITSFQERTGEDLAKAIAKMESNGKLEGVILDMRGNPGGLLDQAVRVTNVFVDEGPVVYTIGRDRSKKEAEFAQKGQMKTSAPMVVLVDGSTASASEIVAGALQDYGRAVIAGQKTFGKGSVQTIIPMSEDSGLKITIARYYTPAGRSIQALGITPDVELEDIDSKTLEQLRNGARRLREADLEGHFAKEGEDEEDDALDPDSERTTEEAAAKAVLKSDKTDEAKERAQEALLPLEERLKKDYMVIQAQGILRTMSVVQQGPRKPEFKLVEESGKKAKAK